MKIIIFQILLSCLSLSCSSINRDKIVDKVGLTGRDYRLFQNTPAWELAKAVQDEDKYKINEIISKEPKLINYQDPKYGNTLLAFTVKNQQMISFVTLLERGADVNVHNTFDGSSAIIEAVRLRDYDIQFAKKLIEAGANVNDVETGDRRKGNSTRETPLISAVGSGKMAFVELLVKNGADINYQNEFEQSALSTSVIVKEYEITCYLLQNGGDYKRPIFYRKDLSIPTEKQDPTDKGKPMYFVDILREAFLDFDTNEYKYKMLIIDFLKKKGIDYRSTPIPEYVKKKAQEKYPDNWEEYLEKY